MSCLKKCLLTEKNHSKSSHRLVLLLFKIRLFPPQFMGLEPSTLGFKAISP